jgi:RimJ/RimL family protein N-acetyltransferase
MTVTLTIPTFETERLILREPRMTDVDAFADFLNSDRARFVGGPGRTYFDSARAFGHMSGMWVLRGYGPHVFCLRDGTPIGHGGPWYPKVWPEPEFGWCLWSGDHEGKGYVTEAMTVLRDWAFADLGLTTVVAYMDTENYASHRVAQRLGGYHDLDAVPPDPDPIVIYRFNAPGAVAGQGVA